MAEAVIIFSGFNQRGVIAFLRSLYELNDKDNSLKFGVIALSKGDKIFKTVYKKNIVAVRSQIELNLFDLIETIRRAKKKLKVNSCLILPSTEALNRFLLKNRNIFKKENCQIPLVDKKIYEKISDKLKFSEICKNAGILVPEKVIPEKKSIPFVAKPKKYFSSQGKVFYPFLIKNSKEYEFFIKNFNQDDFFFQRYIYGRSIYLLYYFYRDGKVIEFSQENLIQQSGGKSIIAAIPGKFHFLDISKKFKTLLKSMNFFGLIMIELRKEKENYYMIEANPRVWGPSQLFVDAKVNLFEDLLYDFGYIRRKEEIIPQYGIRYFWNGGIISNTGKLKFHNYSLRKFIDEYSQWIKFDVYLRKDTLQIYLEEIKEN